MVQPSKRYDFPDVQGLDEVLEDIIEALKDLDKDNFRQYANLEGVNLSSGDNTVTSVTIGGTTIGSGEFDNLDGLDQPLKTTDSPTFDDLTITTPVNIYALSHDSFADFLTAEHIDWTNTSENLKTTGNAEVDAFTANDIATLNKQLYANDDVFISGALICQTGTFTDINISGTLTLIDTVWDDLFLPISVTKLGVTAPTWTAFHGNIKQYTFAINDFVQGSFELLHGYKEGTDLEIHVHIVTNGADASKEVRYSFEYWIADMAEASTTAATLTSLDKALTNADGQHEFVDIGTISGTGFKIGAIICFLFKRVALTDGDNPSADPFVVSVGCHYEKDTVGSDTELVK